MSIAKVCRKIDGNLLKTRNFIHINEECSSHKSLDLANFSEDGIESGGQAGMTTPTLLRAADRVARPWKNGGGITREIAAFPKGAGIEDFNSRISMAEVALEGSFSTFSGVNWILAVLSGTMRLIFDGDDVHDLTSAAGLSRRGCGADGAAHGAGHG